MNVYRAHVWTDGYRAHSAILVGWMIHGGPHDGQVIVQLPGDNQTHRLVDADGWHGDRLSANLDAVQRLRDMGCDAQAARITHGE